MSVLLPCRKCGSKEAELFSPYEKNIPGTWRVVCRECGFSTGYEMTEAEAMTAWNTRAERTYKNTDIDDDTFFTCSACGVECSVEWGHSGWGVPRFCPNCGAKAVEE